MLVPKWAEAFGGFSLRTPDDVELQEIAKIDLHPVSNNQAVYLSL